MSEARIFTLVVAGNSESDYEDALHEALRLIKQGNLSGTNRNEDSGFYFESTTDVPAGELPAK